MTGTNALACIARKELGDALRSRWVWTVALLLATSVVVVAFLGAAPAGVTGIRADGPIHASLMNLAVYLVPLLALMLGCGAIIEEKSRGTLDLILVHPLAPSDYFFGTFLGFAMAMAIAVLGGFGLSGVVLSIVFGLDLGAHLALTGLALLLGTSFLALSFLLSLLARDRDRAIASSVFVWLGTVLIFDLLLIGLLMLVGGQVPAALFGALLLVNPTDVFRLLCFTWIEGVASPLGLTDVLPHAPSATLLATALVLWAVVPLVASWLLFERRVSNDTLV